MESKIRSKVITKFTMYYGEVKGYYKIFTGGTQKHSFISSSYEIKTYWNIFINMGLQIH